MWWPQLGLRCPNLTKVLYGENSVLSTANLREGPQVVFPPFYLAKKQKRQKGQNFLICPPPLFTSHPGSTTVDTKGFLEVIYIYIVLTGIMTQA